MKKRSNNNCIIQYNKIKEEKAIGRPITVLLSFPTEEGNIMKRGVTTITNETKIQSNYEEISNKNKYLHRLKNEKKID